MTAADDDQLPLSFLRKNARSDKPRTRAMTEIRGPYYTPMGSRYLRDVMETAGAWVDGLKFAGGSFAVLPRRAVRELIEIAHEHQAYVSTGGFIEYVLTQGPDAVDAYLRECRELGFDTVEISSGFITTTAETIFRLIDLVHQQKMKAKVEVGIQFGAGGASTPEALESEGLRDVGWVIEQTRRFLEAGADTIMLESEGITESVKTWRMDVPGKFAAAIGLERIMFEAADPEVFAWYVKNFGPEVNLFVDHSQIVQLECLRQGIWGTQSLWGRVVGG